MNQLTLRDRLGIAWGVVTGRGIKTAATLLPTWENERPSYPPTDFETLTVQGWRKNELIFACVNKTANTASQVELSVKRKTGGKELLDHPLKKLLQAPNPYMSEFDFWSAVIIYQKLGGRAAFEKVRNRRGEVIQLWPLRPDWLLPVASSKSFISHYEYQVPGVPDPIVLPVEDVVDFKLFDPVNQYHGWPPAAVAARVGDVDNSVTDFVKLFFEKGGVPPGLLKSRLKLTDTAVADIRRRWQERYGGVEKWTQPAVLDSDAEWMKTGLNFEEMGFETLDARNEARVCMVMDVPAILVGAKIGLDRATYANYGEARLAWWEDSLTPLYTNFLDVIYNQLATDFTGNFICEWDFSGVWAFQEETAKIWTRALDGLRSGGLTVNEFRMQVGMEEVNGQDVFIRQMAFVEIDKVSGEMRTYTPVKVEEGEKEKVSSSSGQEEEGEGKSAGQEEGKSAGLLVSLSSGQEVSLSDDKGEGEGTEEELKRVMAGYLREQLKLIEAELVDVETAVTVNRNGNGG